MPLDAEEGRRFFLAAPPEAEAPRLAPGELHHALHVVRLRVGEALTGLDGLGRAWPLVVREAGRADLQLALDGKPTSEPAPGTEGAALPYVEVAVSLPRAGRAEGLLDRLTQLGVAAIRPLLCERTPPGGRALAGARRERLERVTREACKQSGRLWLPELLPSTELADALGAGDAPLTWLDPGASEDTVGCWAIAQARASARRLRIFVGPEGGWTDAEHDLAAEAGAIPTRVAAHVLRVETAAESAVAATIQAFL